MLVEYDFICFACHAISCICNFYIIIPLCTWECFLIKEKALFSKDLTLLQHLTFVKISCHKYCPSNARTVFLTLFNKCHVPEMDTKHKLFRYRTGFSLSAVCVVQCTVVQRSVEGAFFQLPVSSLSF